jgi:hypothetical protein
MRTASRGKIREKQGTGNRNSRPSAECPEVVLDTRFEAEYASLNDEELLHIAGDRRDLLAEAVRALDIEMARRGLTQDQARAKKREALRLEMNEARAHRPKRNKSRYFIAHLNLREYFIGLIVLVLLMVLTLGSHRLQEEWKEPILFVYIGTLIAFVVVQPWVRRTFNFWVSLAVASIPQFVVGHWLTAHHSAHTGADFKGSGLLSMLAGWVVGVPVFLLLQKLKPEQNVNVNGAEQ